MSTPAIAALRSAGVPFRVDDYDPGGGAGGFGDAVVEALDLDPAATAKTLVVELDNGSLAVALVAVDRRLSLKRVAAAAGAKRATMADAAAAERATGSVVGGISPFGLRRPLPVFVDEPLLATPEVHVSGGRRGLEVTLAPADLVVAAAATVAPLSDDPAH